MKSLSEQQVLVVNAIEQIFWETGSIPALERIAEITGVRIETIRTYWKNDLFREALSLRGVRIDQQQENKLLTTKQLQVANMLLNIYDKRSDRQKFEEAGVSPQQVSAWRRDPVFQSYLTKRAEQLFSSSDSDAFKALIETMKGGDVSALKLFMEMRGKYNPRVQLDINIEQVLVRVVEVISRHVVDPATRMAIANDLQDVINPRVSEDIEPQIPVAAAISSDQFSL